MKSDKKKTAEAEIAAATKKPNKNLYAIPGVILILALVAGGYWWYSQKKTVDYKTAPVGNAQSPIEAYKMLYGAVKSKDSEKIKQMLSENSLAFAGFVSGQQKKGIDEVVVNGFTATTFSDTLPQIRDERIKDGFGALEVMNPQTKQWEDLPFMIDSNITVEAIGENRDGVVAILTESVKIPAEKVNEFLSQLPQTINGLTNVQAEDIRKKFAEAGATASVKSYGWKLAIGDMFKGTYEKPGLGQSVKEQEAANSVSNNMMEIKPDANANTTNVNVITPTNGNPVNKNLPQVITPKNGNK